MQLLFLFLFGIGCSAKEWITIDYTAENLITRDEDMFSAHLVLETAAKPFIEIMDEAALIDPRFRYTTEEFEGYGHYVTSINEVYEDPERQLAWALLKLTPDGYCSLNVGISTYIPYDGEHIVYQLETWDIHEGLPVCPDT